MRVTNTNIRGNGRVEIDADSMPIGQNVVLSVAIRRPDDPDDFHTDVIHVTLMRTGDDELEIGIIDVGADDTECAVDTWPDFFAIAEEVTA